MENLINEKLAILRRQIETYNTQGGEVTAGIIRGGQGKEVMDKIRASIGEMKTKKSRFYECVKVS